MQLKLSTKSYIPKGLYKFVPRCNYINPIAKGLYMKWTHRTDTATSQIIDIAVRMADTDGAVFAWAFLAQHNISDSSIARILSVRRRPVVSHISPGTLSTVQCQT